MPLDALPPHLQTNPLPLNDGTDLSNPVQRYWSRGWTAFGPRVENQRWTWARVGIPWTRFSIPIFPVLARWRMFPKLLFGYNVPRWMGPEDRSVLFVGRFVNKMFWPWTKLYQVPAIEMKDSNPKYSESITAMLSGRLWNAAKERYDTVACYGVSRVQKFAYGVSWSLSWPAYVGFSYRKRRAGREDFVFMFYAGAAHDSGDMYFNFPALYLGFRWK